MHSPYSKISKMRVVKLKGALSERGLDFSGPKSALVARLETRSRECGIWSRKTDEMTCSKCLQKGMLFYTDLLKELEKLSHIH